MSSGREAGLPPAVEFDWTKNELRSYWWARFLQHGSDTYAGVGMCKFPEDLRTYEHLLWIAAPDTVIEVGTLEGGSALWFRDRLRALHAYRRIGRPGRVISVDIDQSRAQANLAVADPDFADEICLLQADVTDPTLPDRVASLLRPGASCLVVDDSAHVRETTRAALEGFGGFVPEGGFFVVEDGFVDLEEMQPPGRLGERLDLPHGVLPALEDWLTSPDASDFVVRRDLELYGVSAHPRGILQRRGSGAR